MINQGREGNREELTKKEAGKERKGTGKRRKTEWQEWNNKLATKYQVLEGSRAEKRRKV